MAASNPCRDVLLKSGVPDPVDWTETETDEKWFINHMSNICAGGFQPLTSHCGVKSADRLRR
jgi:hypothetical protein